MPSDRGLWRYNNGTLIPEDRRAREMMTHFHARALGGKPLIYMLARTPRNPEFSALAHVVFSKIADGVGSTIEHVKLWLKEKTGRYDDFRIEPRRGPTHRKVRGKIMRQYHSVAFESMTEEQFRAFWQDADPFIADLIGGFDTEDGAAILAIMNGEDRRHQQ